MDSIERLLGSLQAHQESEEKRLNSIEKKIDHLSSKVEDLKEFRLKLIGQVSGISFMVSLMISLITLMISIFK